MAFERSTSKIPTVVGSIELVLNYTPSPTPTYAATYRAVILDQDGAEMRVRGDVGDLIPHLNNADRNALVDIINRLYTTAQTEFIG